MSTKVHIRTLTPPTLKLSAVTIDPQLEGLDMMLKYEHQASANLQTPFSVKLTEQRSSYMKSKKPTQVSFPQSYASYILQVTFQEFLVFPHAA